MEKPATRQPFFSRLLERQEKKREEGKKGAEKPTGEENPPHTMKYPSDSDETK